jgi:hypothetical protein
LVVSTGQRHRVERSTIVVTASVVTFLGVAAALGLSGRAVPVLRRLVLDGPLIDALLLAWVVLVLLRNPYPGLALGTGRLCGWRHRRGLVIGIRVITLLMSVVFLGAGLGLDRALAGVPGLQYLLVVLVAIAGVTMIARRMPKSDVSRIELLVAVPFTFGLVAELLAPGGSAMTTFDWVLSAGGAIAVAAGVGIVAGAPVRPPVPFDDPLKLMLGGIAVVAVSAFPSVGLTINVVLALLVMPTIVAVVELDSLAGSGTIGGRSEGVPVLDVLREPLSPLERDLRRIKGTYRRVRSRELIESGEQPASEMLSHDLPEPLKFMLQSQVSSQARGGEDLPDLLDGEVEIARITYTQTVHGEVVSLRGVRAGDDRMALRLVDEYGTDFTLPFDEVTGSISAEEVVQLFLTAVPSPVDVGAFSVLSDVIPDIHSAFARAHQLSEKLIEPRGIGAAIRGWFSMGVMGAITVARMTLDFRGYAVSYEARFYGFGVVLLRGIVNALIPHLAPILWALWIPVPALVVRRIRTIGIDTIRADAPSLVFGAAAVGVMGAVVFELPIWFGVLTIGPSIVMLYLMFRQGPTEHAILSPAWDAQR